MVNGSNVFRKKSKAMALNYKKTWAAVLFLALCSFLHAAGELKISHIDPPMWWTGMKNPELLLTIHGQGIADLNPVIRYPGVTIKTITRSENPNYLFLFLEVGKDARAGTM